MTKFQRLCLDAVERCGAPYLATVHICDYVSRRRWFLSYVSIYIAMEHLEALGYVQSQKIPRLPRDRYEYMTVYKRTGRVDVGETVPLAPNGAR